MIAEIFVLRYNKGAKYEKGDFENEKNFALILTFTIIRSLGALTSCGGAASSLSIQIENFPKNDPV